MTSAAQDMLVGFAALALLPLIGRRIWRGVRDGRLPVYRSCLDRADGGARFGVLLALHALALLVALVATDLLLGLGWREHL